ncbi:MAG: tail-specific protease [Desulfuromonas sp.]|nr:MAG: tail-specific protease [Desulfuromonas sp.]
MRIWMKRLLVLFLLIGTGLFCAAYLAASDPEDLDNGRAKLLSYIVRQQLTNNHYQPRELDQQFAADIFALYLEQLDPQKRFLLKDDVTRLEQFTATLNRDFKKGRLQLPEEGRRLLHLRIRQVQPLVLDLLAAPFSFDQEEFFETDPEKLAFCSNSAELRERWRKALKSQTLARYIDKLEELEQDGETPTPERRKELEGEAREKVSKTVTGFFERLLEDSDKDHYNEFLATFSRTFDPHTNYLPPRQKEDFDIHMRGSLEGIGATLREEDGYIKVVSIIPGGAASRQGELAAEDLILEVAQDDEEPVDITNMRLREAVGLIRGPKGSTVRLSVRKPDGRRVLISIVRDVVQIEETFVKGTLLEPESSEKRYGYIKIPTFYRDFSKYGEGRNSTDDMREELERLSAEAPLDGLILDLRNNGGGALTDAVSIAGLFISKGPIVQVRNGDGTIKTLSDTDNDIAYDGPMVVLVNRFSASASEILAGALQDYRRALIIGSDHTHGKGTVQAIVDLDRHLPFRNMQKYLPLGALMVTIQKFYRVSGDSTQYRGVVPDIILPDRQQHLETGERYLDHSLPWDTVRKTNYTPWRNALPDFAHLQELSTQRQQQSELFTEIRAQAELLEQRSKQTRIPLELTAALAEREKIDSLRETSIHGTMNVDDGEEEQDLTTQLKDDAIFLEGRALLDDIIRLNGQGGVARTPRSANGY